MEAIQITKYKCCICGAMYDTPQEAVGCEEKQVTMDRGVKVGDEVIITYGGGKGRAKVSKVFVLDKYWGHYAWKTYWHTIALMADCIDSYGSRLLTFADYEVKA